MRRKLKILALVVSILAVAVASADVGGASAVRPVIAAGLWEVHALHQSIGLQGSEDMRPVLSRNSRRFLVCRAEKALSVNRGPPDAVIRGAVGSEDMSAVALLFFDKQPADRGGRLQTLMEVYRGDFSKDFTITTIVDDPRSYLPPASEHLVPVFGRTLERFTRRGDCPSGMQPGDQRGLPSP
jgi:hypothetical protein